MILVDFYLNTQYNTDKLGLEKRIDGADKKTPDTKEHVKKTYHNAKVMRLNVKYLILLA